MVQTSAADRSIHMCIPQTDKARITNGRHRPHCAEGEGVQVERGGGRSVVINDDIKLRVRGWDGTDADGLKTDGRADATTPT